MTSLLLDALAGKQLARPPIWLMRQAGRYLPEYREIRRQVGGFLELCYTPELAVEVTHQPIRRYGFDAAILFSDILVVPDALGADVRFVESEGPKLRPVRDQAAVAQLSSATLEQHLAPVFETVRRLRATLPAEVALIGFAGAPWTVASYMVEGETSKEFQEARLFARRDPEGFGELIDLVTESTIRYLRCQIDAGADVLQLFDSWAGVLPQDQFARWCEQPMARIVRAIRETHPHVPIIGFPRGAGVLYRRYLQNVPVDGISLDTTMPVDWAAESLDNVCLQGNLDPIALLAGGEAMFKCAGEILKVFAGRPFIFNLGHGVLPPTDPKNVADLVRYVRSHQASV